MPKKPQLSDEEKDLFRDAMRGVKPLPHTKVTAPAAKPPARRKAKESPQDDDIFAFSDYETLAEVGSEDILEFSRSGVQYKMLRKLRQGQYNVEALLDLHGKTVEEAREALGKFLLRCKQNKLRHVLVIHGKGRSNNKPILKNKLNNWLRQTDQVIAFCSATPKDGRGGALYILLRR